MKKVLLAVIVMLITEHGLAQERNYWNKVRLKKSAALAKRARPQNFQLFTFDAPAFEADTNKIPIEIEIPVGNSPFIFYAPNASGGIERFRVVESPVMDHALAQKFPQIKSYLGKGIDDSSATIRFDNSPLGFHAVVNSAERSTFYINPTKREGVYAVFSRDQAENLAKSFNCRTVVDHLKQEKPVLPENRNNGANDGRLRTFRLAMACTGEYANFFLSGNEVNDYEKKARVLAAMNSLVARINQVYERDFGIRLLLISNNDKLIYLNADKDPWTDEWNDQTQTTIDAEIGDANYDIGHLLDKVPSFDENGGDANYIGCVGKSGHKGSAYTAHVMPEGNPFVIDYVAHEMGHQFGANHTFTYRDTNEVPEAQVEPGSGSTIMGYAGITGIDTNVQVNSDDYFHAKSIEQVSNYIKFSSHAACAVIITNGNTAPQVDAGPDYVVPRSTPFLLSGSASDAEDNHRLDYCWEEMDGWFLPGSATIPDAQSTRGPQFRSFTYARQPYRMFPALPYILSGDNYNRWEMLPGVQRELHFRLTVRDNHPGSGNNNSDDVVITVTEAGPFSVASPNTSVTWARNSVQTVLWNVNQTNLAPVNCTNVKIALSTDGGLTFPIVLSESTSNDGAEKVRIPDIVSKRCRIKVEAVNNIFFDISNKNFNIR